MKQEEQELVYRNQLPNIMKTVRKALKLSQKQLSEEMLKLDISGASRESISYWEDGKVAPGIASIRAWLKVTSCEITKLREFKERSEAKAAKERSKESRRKVKGNE